MLPNIKRRALLGVAAVATIAASPFAHLYAATTVRHIGILSPGPAPTDELTEYESLRGLGWIVGQNLVVHRRDANNRPELLRPFAEELVRLKVEIIVAYGTMAALAAKSVTSTIPIVFSSAGDPVASSLVASLARPGANVTGVSIVGPEVNAKRLSMLRELLPDLKRIGALENRTNPSFRAQRPAFEQACRSLALEPIIVEVTAEGELEAAITEMVRQGAQALLIQPDSLFTANLVPIMKAATRYRLPALAAFKGDGLMAGALISFGHDEHEIALRYASHVDRILRGAKPADLPVEQPTKFEVGINLKAAKALGIDVPQALLLQAHEGLN